MGEQKKQQQKIQEMKQRTKKEQPKEAFSFHRFTTSIGRFSQFIYWIEFCEMKFSVQFLIESKLICDFRYTSQYSAKTKLAIN